MILNTPKVQLLTNEAVFNYFQKEIRPLFSELDFYQEHLFVIGFDTNHNIIFTQLLAIGTSHAVSVNIKDLIRYPVLNNAKSIIMLHTHPNKEEPSPNDIEITKKFGKILFEIGIKLNDHLVIYKDGFCNVNKILKEQKENAEENPKKITALLGHKVAVPELNENINKFLEEGK